MRSLILLMVITVFLASCKSQTKTNSLPTSERAARMEQAASVPVPSPRTTLTAAPTLSLAPEETAVTIIPLAGDVSQRGAEISGMTWYGDWLILLPQYPNFGGVDGDGRVFALSREDIMDFLSGDIPGPLTPQSIPFVAPGLSHNIAGYEGYEAIVIDSDTVYLTVEAGPSSGMTGHLVKGIIAQDLSELRVDTDQVANISSATDLPNKSDEAMLLMDERLLTIYEANGKSVNSSPVATLFDLELELVGTMPITSIEYRITDVTAVDEHGRFWAINYYFPGEPELSTEHDPLAETYGQGATHAVRDGVERLIEFQMEDDAITLVDQPPLQLELLADDLRNWEGITRLEDRGFLLVTDKFPQTILGFVPFP